MRKYIVLLFLLIISNILNSQSINTYDESKPIISTGNNPTFNVSNYLLKAFGHGRNLSDDLKIY